MSQVRWVKGAEELAKAKDNDPEFLRSTVRSIRTVYETEPAVVKAVIPQPLEPGPRPEVQVTLSQVSIHVSPEMTIEIGSTIFGVTARYEGSEGLYLLTMPMTSEAAVIGGRETYGEPKKIADIEFDLDGPEIGGRVTRMGIPYIAVRGRIGDAIGPRKFSEHAFCFKALPSCDPGRDFDGDPILVQLEWQHEHTRSAQMEGEVVLRDSPFDPVADLPVHRIVRMEYEEGTTKSNGRVLRSVPGDWLLPFLHGRYDQPGVQGIEV